MLSTVSVFAYTVRSGHPRIYINSDNIADIRTRCTEANGVQDDYYLNIKNYGDIHYSDTPAVSSIDLLRTCAFLYVIGEISGVTYSSHSIEDFGAKGVTLLKDYASYFAANPETGTYCSIKAVTISYLYDWLYSKLTPQERIDIVTDLITVADYQKANRTHTDHYSGWTIGGHNYVVAGLAFYNDGINNAKAIEYCDDYKSYYQDKFIPAFNFASNEGGSPQGNMYGTESYPHRFIYPVGAWTTATYDNDWENFDYYKNLGKWYLYNLVPHWLNKANTPSDVGDALVRYGDMRYTTSDISASMAAWSRVTTAYTKDNVANLATWIIEQHVKATSFGGLPPEAPYNLVDDNYMTPRTKPFDIMWRDEEIEAKSPTVLNLPLTKFFGSTDGSQGIHPAGMGVVVMKTAWEDVDATLAFFKCQPYKYVHDHYDQNSFTLTKKGLLAIDSGQYEGSTHDKNYGYRSIAHNTVIVYNSGEVFIDETYSNDGGQRIIYRPDNYTDLIPGSTYDLGGIEKFVTSAGKYDYMLGNATNAYSDKISQFTREFVFARPNYFIVFDVVVSTNSSFEKKWLLHTVNEPSITGSVTDSGAGYTTYDGNLSSATESSGKLFCKTLLPSSATITKRGGVNHRFEDAEGNNWALQSYGYNDVYGAWRIEVEPVSLNEKDLFLHVLYPCETAVSSMTTTRTVESTNSKAIGTHIEVNGAIDGWCVMFSTTTVDLTGITYDVNDNGNVNHLICGLKPNTRFNVYKDSVIETSLFTPEAGTLYFEDTITSTTTYQIQENSHIPLVPSIIGGR
jgi:hypothetical protein